MKSKTMALVHFARGLMLVMFMVMIIVACTIYAAQAQTTTPAPVTARVDITPFLTAMITFMSLILPALGAWIAYVINKHMGIASNTSAALHVQTLVNDAANFGLGEIQIVAAHNGTVSVPKAVENAMKQVSTSGLAAAEQLGITPAILAQKVNNKLVTMMPPALVTSASVTAPAKPAFIASTGTPPVIDKSYNPL
jgi:hypothetical protein